MDVIGDIVHKGDYAGGRPSALVPLLNYPLGERRYLRIAFRTEAHKGGESFGTLSDLRAICTLREQNLRMFAIDFVVLVEEGEIHGRSFEYLVEHDAQREVGIELFNPFTSRFFDLPLKI